MIYFFMTVFFIVLLFLATQFDYIPKDVNLQKVEQGSMTTLNYKGHSYIAWAINMGGGIVHDPDCECYKKIYKE